MSESKSVEATGVEDKDGGVGGIQAAECHGESSSPSVVQRTKEGRTECSPK